MTSGFNHDKKKWEISFLDSASTNPVRGEPPVAIPEKVFSLPPGVEQGCLLPPQNQMVGLSLSSRFASLSTVNPSLSRSAAAPARASGTQRSNLSALLEPELSAAQRDDTFVDSASTQEQSLRSPQQHLKKTSLSDEADSASGPCLQNQTTIVRSAPTHMDGPSISGGLAQTTVPMTNATPSRDDSHQPSPSRSFLLPFRAASEIHQPSQTTSVRRCLSSRELGTLAPPSGSPFANILHKREAIEATLQLRLKEARKSTSSIVGERSQTSSPIASNDQSFSSDSCSSRRRSNGRNETRVLRRAQHNRAVVDELCEIVSDLFAAEAKLLNPVLYGVESGLERERFLQVVRNFVSALPPRYALGVDTPSEVLLHMRLMAAARSDNTKVVVHISNLSDDHWGSDKSNAISRGFDTRSSHLVTIACCDAHGLLEYITKILATGGSRVLDADVMLSRDNIVLDRFVVEMNGRLRLDKFTNSVEAFLEKKRSKDESESTTGSSLSAPSADKTAHPGSVTTSHRSAGPLYIQPPPTKTPGPSPSEIKLEIESAVPLAELIAASSSSQNLMRAEDLVPFRSTPSGSLRRGHSMPNTALAQPILSQEGSTQSPQFGGPGADSKLVPPTRRSLVRRDATYGLGDNLGLDYVAVPVPPANSESPEEHHIPLIPFEELMLIETLGMGRVSTIYRAAWQRQLSVRPEPDVFSNVKMVALKVATINSETGDTAHVDELRREADIAAMLDHPNICHLIGVAADPECFCLAFEFCEGGSLLSLLSDTSRYYEYLPIALDIANGMAYLHDRNVIHRDLKPSNVLLSRDHRAKIADFGMSVANKGQELTAETGTYRYMAPEVIRHESYSSNADVYSFGLVLWQLITREVPFATMTPIQAAFAVAEGSRPEIPPSCPPRLREIIEACWDPDSHRRPSFTYIAMALADYARMAFSPANVGAQTLQIANEMLFSVAGNATINVDFSTPVGTDRGASLEGGTMMSDGHMSSTTSNVGLEI